MYHQWHCLDRNMEWNALALWELQTQLTTLRSCWIIRGLWLVWGILCCGSKAFTSIGKCKLFYPWSFIYSFHWCVCNYLLMLSFCFIHINIYNVNETIPKPYELNDTKHWGSVSTAHARFELYLQQIAKVTVSPVEMNNMLNSEKLWPKSISPNPFKVFIYTVEQLHDQNLTRGAQFRLDLQEFLRLKKTLVDFSQVPKKNAVNAWEYAEYFDICEPRYDGIRRKLLQQGTETRRWILDKFIKSRDVVVSNKDFFEDALSTWSEDLCQ